MPNTIIAIPTATEFTRGRLQIKAWMAPNNAPTPPAARTPIQGEPVL